MTSISLRSKFRGCLMGTLLGDCIGSVFEHEVMTPAHRYVVKILLEHFEDADFEHTVNKLKGSASLMRSLGDSLLKFSPTDYKAIAVKLANDFFLTHKRAHAGEAVMEVLYKLKFSKPDNVFQPAKEIYNLKGSHGGTAATMIAPLCLYYYDDYNSMIETTRNTSKIIQSHIWGINGALLQCIAIHQCLHSGGDSLSVTHFIDQLRTKMKVVEERKKDHSFSDKLLHVSKYLAKKIPEDLTEEYSLIVDDLGHGTEALECVPTAIFSFLRTKETIPEMDTNCWLRRALEYAISLGGDTKKLACLAGGLVGALTGEDECWEALKRASKRSEEVLALADNLYEIATKKEKK